MLLRKLTAFLFVLLFAGTAYAAEPIKIGVYLPLTGQNAFGGQLELEGVQLAHKEMPTVLGRPVELIIVDNKSDKVEAANAVTRLTAKEHVTGIIGTYGSSLALAGGEVAEKAKTPVISTSATNPLVTQGKRYYFRACFSDPYQGAGAATFAFNELKTKKAAILQDVASDYGVGLASFFNRSFRKLGGEVVSVQNYQSGDQDFSAQLTEIISKQPDVMFIPAYFAEGAIIIKQARDLGATFRIIGGDAMDNPEMVTIGGKSVEGFLQTTFPYAPDMPDMNPMAKKFTENWYATYKKDPNVNASLGYTCYMMFMKAIETAGSDDREAITEALSKLKDFQAVTGNLTMDEEHNAVSPIGIIEIKDGQRVYRGEFTPVM